MLALGSSKKSHRERIVTLAFAIRLKTLGNADKRGRSDAPFVRFLGRAKRKHCEICVRLNHLCEGILVRLPKGNPGCPRLLIDKQHVMPCKDSRTTYSATLVL